MRFAQRSLFSSQELSLETQGLYVCRKNGHGQKTVEFLFPYEEMLPLRLERHRTLPLQGFGLLAVGLALTGWELLRDFANTQDTVLAEAWLPALSILVLLGLFIYYGINNWWYHITLSTPHLNVMLADRPRQQADLLVFASALEIRTKAYLRNEYGGINPLGIIEPQLRRVAWLRELDVLSAPEATAMATRLTGRLTADPLRSMGQELEAPYVN
jgi:hypothetical protein